MRCSPPQTLQKGLYWCRHFPRSREVLRDECGVRVFDGGLRCAPPSRAAGGHRAPRPNVAGSIRSRAAPRPRSASRKIERSRRLQPKPGPHRALHSQSVERLIHRLGRNAWRIQREMKPTNQPTTDPISGEAHSILSRRW